MFVPQSRSATSGPRWSLRRVAATSGCGPEAIVAHGQYDPVVTARTFSLAAGEQDVLAHARVSPELAVSELVWNALDADARSVHLELRRDVVGGPPVRLIAIDDGHGMGPHEIDDAFGSHRRSRKSGVRTSPQGRPMHGRNGCGRFRSFAIAQRVRWRTWAPDELGEVTTSEVTIRCDAPTEGEIDTIADSLVRNTTTGTSVDLLLLDSQKAARVGDSSFRRRLEAVLAPTLLSLSGATVTYDGSPLDPESQIEQRDVVSFEAELADYHHFDGSAAGQPVLDVIEWENATVPPAVFLCDENGGALFEFDGARLARTPGLNWTAYLRWEGFARDNVSEGDLQAARATFTGVIEPALAALAEHLHQRTETLADDVIGAWVSDGTYPYAEVPDSLVEEAEQAGFRELVTVARKAVPADPEQRRLTLGLMQAAFKESPDDALEVIAKVKGLNAEEVRDFRLLLEQTTLSSVSRASKMLTDRIDFLLALDELLHGEDQRDQFLERDHLHRLVEKNAWIFGNEWSLVRSEASLVSALREHLALLRPEEKTRISTEDVDRGGRRIDMLLAGATSEHRRVRRLVVELKRSSLVLHREERDQIESYAQALAAHPKFQAELVHWEFWLLGTTIGGDIAPSLTKRGEPVGLFQEVQLDNGSTYDLGPHLVGRDHRGEVQPGVLQSRTRLRPRRLRRPRRDPRQVSGACAARGWRIIRGERLLTNSRLTVVASQSFTLGGGPPVPAITPDSSWMRPSR